VKWHELIGMTAVVVRVDDSNNREYVRLSRHATWVLDRSARSR
jgi:hypothetical protein